MKETCESAIKKGWIIEKDFPEWGNNPLYIQTISGGYLLKNETPRQAYRRISKAAAERINMPHKENVFFDIFWKGWAIPSTPVMANMGTEKGLPISCFGGVVPDSMYGIGRKNLEMMMLSKHGGGTAYDFSDVRSIGSPIKNGLNGTSEGIIPFIKGFDSFIMASKQGDTRWGATAVYLDAKHDEYLDWLTIREPKGDPRRQCMDIHQGSKWDDDLMHKVEAGEPEVREKWIKTIMQRVKTGEPYIMFTDNANKNLKKTFEKFKLKVRQSQLCTEIFLPSDELHTFVCCLLSLNAARYSEWSGTDTPKEMIFFLEGVMEEFIQKGKDIYGIEDAVRFAQKSRALGLGVLGWHSFLKSKMIPFISIQANSYTKLLFGEIQKKANEASMELAEIFGEPEWCQGSGYRHLTNMAIAPNRTSAKLAGGLSQGVEPDMANFWSDDGAKGTHIRKDQHLADLLEAKGRNTSKVWEKIGEAKGSVQELDFLSDYEKAVFLTFREINQLEIVKQACLRQQYIDQGQSINLAFFKDAPAKWINQVHLEAWKGGLKSLYYLRSESNLRADSKNKRDLYSECLMCEA